MPGFASVRMCYDRVCPRIRLGGWLNEGVLGSVQYRLSVWQGLEWEQKNMWGRALALQIGSEMAPRPLHWKSQVNFNQTFRGAPLPEKLGG